ncbi:ankyrin repeat domain-containing protein [Candidatus Sororendozoicomonas aggregata]|uniref:ankyrin repeat domain-containing protein n=1 Tax=Candidatus Sororendozoicomonas aggregata TaxID=3073239 RepID=UPI002ECFEBD7
MYEYQVDDFNPDDYPGDNRYQPIFMAIVEGNLDRVKEIVERNKPEHVNLECCEFNYTPSIMAAMYGRLEILKYLIRKGADINKMDCFGRTPLEVAVDIYRVDLTTREAMVAILLRAGANPLMCDPPCEPSMVRAIKVGAVNIAKMCLENGAYFQKEWDVPFGRDVTEEQKEHLRRLVNTPLSLKTQATLAVRMLVNGHETHPERIPCEIVQKLKLPPEIAADLMLIYPQEEEKE